jgi:hypothetical protein
VPAATLERLYRDRAESVRRVLAGWEGRPAVHAWDVQDLLSEALAFPALAEQLWQAISQRAAQDGPAPPREIGKQFRTFDEVTEDFADTLRQVLQFARARGLAANHWAAVEPAIKEIDRLRKRYLDLVAWLSAAPSAADPRLLEESRQEIERGEGEDLGEVLRRLQGGGSLLPG